MRVIAILKRSAGNESVGDMWEETASFPVETSVEEILGWARERVQGTNDIKYFRSNLTITIDQSSIER